MSGSTPASRLLDAIKIAVLTNTVPEPNTFPLLAGNYAVWLEHVNDKNAKRFLTRGINPAVFAITKEQDTLAFRILTTDGNFEVRPPKGTPTDEWVAIKLPVVTFTAPADGEQYTADYLLVMRIAP